MPRHELGSTREEPLFWKCSSSVLCAWVARLSHSAQVLDVRTTQSHCFTYYICEYVHLCTEVKNHTTWCWNLLWLSCVWVLVPPALLCPASTGPTPVHPAPWWHR